MNYESYKNKRMHPVIIDIDGHFGGQCWDLFADYSLKLGYKVYNCSSTGYAKDVYNNRIINGILKEYNDLGKTMRRGAVVFFKNSVQTPFSHVGIIDSWDNTYVTVLAQNQNGVHYPTLKKFNRVYVLGVLNPKCFVPELPTGYIRIEKYNKHQTELLQKALNYVTGSKLKIDGVFGRKTEAVLMAYQKSVGLKVNGHYGDKTRAKLKEKLL